MKPACIVAARQFLALLSEGEAPTLPKLSSALDDLAVAYHQGAPRSPDHPQAEAPDLDYDALYKSVGSRFPDLGYYAATDPTKPVADELLTGDAIDDLVDIFKDLSEVSWRFDNEGADSACWTYRTLFEIHWGRHLRDLGLYLHATQFS